MRAVFPPPPKIAEIELLDSNCLWEQTGNWCTFNCRYPRLLQGNFDAVSNGFAPPDDVLPVLDRWQTPGRNYFGKPAKSPTGETSTTLSANPSYSPTVSYPLRAESDSQHHVHFTDRGFYRQVGGRRGAREARFGL